jgi:hypothetical protein
MSAALRQVSLPDNLCVAAERRFGNLEQFLKLVLDEVLRDEADVLDRRERSLIEERLRELGYL